MGIFDWENLAKNIEDGALDDKKQQGYEEDSRFYKLAKDAKGNGGALIRFVPGPDNTPFVEMRKIDANGGANNRFCKEWSPISIGKKDPFNEMFVKLWKAGRKEEAKKFGRKIRYLSNIKVIKDPANPENEGKFFILDMSPTLFDKIKQAIQPSEDEMAIDPDLKPKAVFNPIEGNSFLLKTKTGENGFITYIDSKFSEKIDGIYATEEEALADIKSNGYSVKEFHDEKNFKTYEELQECLNWFMGIDTPAETPEPEPEAEEQAKTPEPEPEAEVKAKTPEPEPEAEVKAETPNPKAEEDNDLDALLDELELD